MIRGVYCKVISIGNSVGLDWGLCATDKDV